MPHVHTDPGDHDHTVSAFIIRTDGPEPRMLLHKHLVFKKWLQVGGHIELKEDPWQAVSHEILEEAGYDMDQLKILQPKDRLRKSTGNKMHPIPLSYFTHRFLDQPHFHTDIAFVFVTDQPPRHKLAARESQEVSYFTLSEVLALKDSFENIKEITEFAIKTCLPNWEAIPTSQFN